MGYCYIIGAEWRDDLIYKVGISKHPDIRLTNINNAGMFMFNKIVFFETNDYRQLERILIKTFESIYNRFYGKQEYFYVNKKSMPKEHEYYVGYLPFIIKYVEENIRDIVILSRLPDAISCQHP